MNTGATTHATAPIDGLHASIRTARLALRNEFDRRMRRLIPVVALAFVILPLLQRQGQRFWASVIGLAGACAIAAIALLARRLPARGYAMLVIGTLSLGGIWTVSTQISLGTAAMAGTLVLLGLLAMQSSSRKWCSNAVCVASCLGIVLLCGLALALGRPFGGASMSAMTWVFLAILFAALAFAVLMESETMFTQTLDSLAVATTAAGRSELPRPVLTPATRADAEPNADFGRRDCRRPRVPHWSMETVAYALSHDLRAPLRAIEGFSNALIQDLGDAASTDVLRDSQNIRAAVARMQLMIGQWSALMSCGAGELHRQAVDLTKIAHSVVAELQAANPERDVRVSIQPNLQAYGDPVLLRQVLQNLIGNAWKFSRSQRLPAHIEVGSYGNSMRTNFFVRDNGIGFASADTARLFAPYSRLANARAFEGSGIGLAIVRSIIEAHGGEIWADAQDGYGAQFSFTLPRAPAAHTAVSGHSEESGISQYNA